MSNPNNKKKKLVLGLLMLAVFVAVLVAVFLPLFPGAHGAKQNALHYLDNLYNSISKGSAYYIPQLAKAAAKFKGQAVKVEVTLADPAQAARAALLFKAAGAKVTAAGATLTVDGDFGAIMASCLKDADDMFHNKGAVLTARYPGQHAKTMLHTWWGALKALQKGLNRQKAFAQAKYAQTVTAKAVEMSYNYYTIKPQSIGDKWGIVLFSLLFYVVYTLWYGFGVMFLFEGAGYQLEGH